MQQQNRHKLVPYCTIDRHDNDANRWIPSYINSYAPDGNLFSVYGSNNTYSQWSNEIKCCSQLLKLSQYSNIFVFDCSINQWCRGHIIYVETFKQYNLDIFTVLYRKERKLCQQYIHQFSSRIALLDKSSQRNNVLLISNNRRSHLDQRYFQQCVNIIKAFIKCITNSFGDNELVFILQRYVGCIYGLVIDVESKTWLSAIKRRDEMLMPKHATIHNEYLLLYEKGSLHSIKHSMNNSKRQLNANAQQFVPSKTNVIKKQKCNSPYKTEYIYKIQKLMRIPRRLTETMCLYTSEQLINTYYYILIMVTLQFELINTCNKIIIFNVNLHDKYTGGALYAVAKQEHLHGYDWKMMNILYSAEEVNNEFGNEKHLPKTISFLFNGYENVMSVLLDSKKFIKIVNATNWCKVKVYHRINNQNRLEFKITQKYFKDGLIKFMNENDKFNLIPILVMYDKNYVIEYLLIIPISKNNTLYDIAVSFVYDIKDEFKVKVTGIHIDREYIVQQHESVHSNCECLKNFTPSNIDLLAIGNPDDYINKIKAKDQIIKKLKQQIKHLNQK